MGKRERYSISEIQSRIQERIRGCALCGSENWELEADLYNLRFTKPWIRSFSKQIQCVLLSCTHCGNTHIINVPTLMQTQKPRKNDPKRGVPQIERGKPEAAVDDVLFSSGED